MIRAWFEKCTISHVLAVLNCPELWPKIDIQGSTAIWKVGGFLLGRSGVFPPGVPKEFLYPPLSIPPMYIHQNSIFESNFSMNAEIKKLFQIASCTLAIRAWFEKCTISHVLAVMNCPELWPKIDIQGSTAIWKVGGFLLGRSGVFPPGVPKEFLYPPLSIPPMYIHQNSIFESNFSMNAEIKKLFQIAACTLAIRAWFEKCGLSHVLAVLDCPEWWPKIDIQGYTATLAVGGFWLGWCGAGPPGVPKTFPNITLVYTPMYIYQIQFSIQFFNE